MYSRTEQLKVQVMKRFVLTVLILTVMLPPSSPVCIWWEPYFNATPQIKQVSAEEFRKLKEKPTITLIRLILRG